MSDTRRGFLKTLGLYESVNSEIGRIIVAQVNAEYVKELLATDRVKLMELISKTDK